MKIRMRPRPRPAETEPIIALINIVFLLLIFFMIAGQLAPQPPFAIDPPPSNARTPAKTGTAVLHMGRNGELAVDGATLRETELHAWLAARPDGVSVQIVADGDVDAQRFTRILAAMQRAGIGRAELVTVERSVHE